MISAIETTIIKSGKNCDKQESFDKRLVQAAIGTKYKLGLGTKNGKQRCEKKI